MASLVSRGCVASNSPAPLSPRELRSQTQGRAFGSAAFQPCQQCHSWRDVICQGPPRARPVHRIIFHFRLRMSMIFAAVHILSVFLGLRMASLVMPRIHCIPVAQITPFSNTVQSTSCTPVKLSSFCSAERCFFKPLWLVITHTVR